MQDKKYISEPTFSLNKQELTGQRAALEKRLKDLEWQISFAKNQIFYCEEKRSRHTEQLQEFRDRAREELKRLGPA
jgi:hypothetical protein